MSRFGLLDLADFLYFALQLDFNFAKPQHYLFPSYLYLFTPPPPQLEQLVGRLVQLYLLVGPQLDQLVIGEFGDEV